MKLAIYIFLLTINLQDSVLRYFYGSISGPVFHLGLLFKGVFLVLLPFVMLKKITQNFKYGKNKYIFYMILFVIFWLFHFFLIEIYIFDYAYAYRSVIYGTKIILFLLVSMFVFFNYTYFKPRFNKIIVANLVVALANVFLGYFFKIGFTSYSFFEDSYRGYMAGNDTSIFVALAFVYGLYLFNKSKIKAIIVMTISCLALYVIATKAFLVALLICYLYMVYKFFEKKKKYIPKLIVFLSAIVLSILPYIIKGTFIWDRLTYNIFRTIEFGRNLMDSYGYSSNLIEILNNFIPVRSVIAISLIETLFNDTIYFLFFGYGPFGIYDQFRRPPMMGFFDILGFYGLVGLVLLYSPLIFLFLNVLKNRKLDLCGLFYITVFLYGTFGGFLFGSANVLVFFGLLSGILIKELSYLKPRLKVGRYDRNPW